MLITDELCTSPSQTFLNLSVLRNPAYPRPKSYLLWHKMGSLQHIIVTLGHMKIICLGPKDCCDYEEMIFIGVLE